MAPPSAWLHEVRYLLERTTPGRGLCPLHCASLICRYGLDLTRVPGKSSLAEDFEELLIVTLRTPNQALDPTAGSALGFMRLEFTGSSSYHGLAVPAVGQLDR